MLVNLGMFPILCLLMLLSFKQCTLEEIFYSCELERKEHNYNSDHEMSYHHTCLNQICFTSCSESKQSELNKKRPESCSRSCCLQPSKCAAPGSGQAAGDCNRFRCSVDVVQRLFDLSGMQDLKHDICVLALLGNHIGT